MKDGDRSTADEARREFLKTTGAGTLGAVLGGSLLGTLATAATPSAAAGTDKAPGGPYNILFI